MRKGDTRGGEIMKEFELKERVSDECTSNLGVFLKPCWSEDFQ